jgi:hypothetical protein
MDEESVVGEGMPEQGEKASRKRYLSPGRCRSHMRETLAREFQAIVDGFVEAAKTGSCQHVKLATELLKPTRKGSTRKKGTAVRTLEQMQRLREERERLKGGK